MSSLSYWERRKAQEMFKYMESAEDAADDIAKLYQKSSGYLSYEMDRIFQRYRNKHHLSESEAYRLLNTLQDKTSIRELKAALRSGDGVRQAILAELESPAYQARLERLQQLQNQINLTMQQVYRQEKIRNTSHYVDLANEAYYRSIFDIQQRTGLGFSFVAIASEDIDRVINSRWSGTNYSELIWHNTRTLAQDLKQELLINLVTGRTDKEVADIIANKFAQGASNARRLVRTESCYLSNQMEMFGYEECDIEYYRFVATLDLRTSGTCRKLDRKRFKVSKQQPGKNCPPMHPWCRSTTIADIDEEALSKLQRRARDPVTEKTMTVPANMTYQEWYNKYVSVPTGKNKPSSYKGIPKTWKRLSSSNSAIQVNPSGAIDNCVNCAIAYEMRKRGYAVVAGESTKRLRRDPFGAWVEPDIVTVNQGIDALSAIESDMKGWGDNSRAQVAVTWNKRGNSGLNIGHSFIAERRNGETIFLDVQSGKEYNKSIFKRASGNDVYYCRIDTLDINDLGSAACRKE